MKIIGNKEEDNINKFISSYKKIIKINDSCNREYKKLHNLLHKNTLIYNEIFKNYLYNDVDADLIKRDLIKDINKGIDKCNKLVKICDELYDKCDLNSLKSKYIKKSENNYSNVLYTIINNEIDLIKYFFKDYKYFKEERDTYYNNYDSYLGFSRTTKGLNVLEDNVKEQYKILNSCCEYDLDYTCVPEIVDLSFNNLVNSTKSNYNLLNYYVYSRKVNRLLGIMYDDTFYTNVKESTTNYVNNTKKKMLTSKKYKESTNIKIKKID